MSLMVSLTGPDLADALRAVVLGRARRLVHEALAEEGSPGFAEEARASDDPAADHMEGQAEEHDVLFDDIRSGEMR